MKCFTCNGTNVQKELTNNRFFCNSFCQTEYYFNKLDLRVRNGDESGPSVDDSDIIGIENTITGRKFRITRDQAIQFQTITDLLEYNNENGDYIPLKLDDDYGISVLIDWVKGNVSSEDLKKEILPFPNLLKQLADAAGYMGANEFMWAVLYDLLRYCSLVASEPDEFLKQFRNYIPILIILYAEVAKIYSKLPQKNEPAAVSIAKDYNVFHMKMYQKYYFDFEKQKDSSKSIWSQAFTTAATFGNFDVFIYLMNDKRVSDFLDFNSAFIAIVKSESTEVRILEILLKNISIDQIFSAMVDAMDKINLTIATILLSDKRFDTFRVNSLFKLAAYKYRRDIVNLFLQDNRVDPTVIKFERYKTLEIIKRLEQFDEVADNSDIVEFTMVKTGRKFKINREQMYKNFDSYRDRFVDEELDIINNKKEIIFEYDVDYGVAVLFDWVNGNLEKEGFLKEIISFPNIIREIAIAAEHFMPDDFTWDIFSEILAIYFDSECVKKSGSDLNIFFCEFVNFFYKTEPLYIYILLYKRILRSSQFYSRFKKLYYLPENKEVRNEDIDKRLQNFETPAVDIVMIENLYFLKKYRKYVLDKVDNRYDYRTKDVREASKAAAYTAKLSAFIYFSKDKDLYKYIDIYDTCIAAFKSEKVNIYIIEYFINHERFLDTNTNSINFIIAKTIDVMNLKNAEYIFGNANKLFKNIDLHILMIIEKKSETFLSLAIRANRIDIFKLLLRLRVDPSKGNNVALKTASTYKHIEMVKLLLHDKRVDPTVISERHKTPEILEALRDRFQTVKESDQKRIKN